MTRQDSRHYKTKFCFLKMIFITLSSIGILGCGVGEEDYKRSRSPSLDSGGAQTDCKLSQTNQSNENFNVAFLQTAVVVNDLDKRTDLCDLINEQPEFPLTILNMLSKDSTCKECWDEVFEVLSEELIKRRADALTYFVINPLQTNLSSFYVPRELPFGIVRDAFGHLGQQRPIDQKTQKGVDALVILNRKGEALWVDETSLLNQNTKDKTLKLTADFVNRSVEDPASDGDKKPDGSPLPTPKPSPDTNPSPLPSPDPIDPVENGLRELSVSNLQAELTYITDDRFEGRLSATEGNRLVGEYIKSILIAHNVPALQSSGYEQSFNLSVGPTRGRSTANLVAKIEGSDPVLKNEYIVIGAHMDHTGTLDLGYTCSAGSIREDKICNGADDNGSGTVAVLNVMKALAKVRGDLKRSVLLIWFSGEEEGLLGAQFFVNNPLVPISSIKYMINLDMVGYIHTNNKRLGALGGLSSSSAAAIIREIGEKDSSHSIQLTTSAGGGSDHVPFMRKGIPGVFFHTGVSNNPNYHRTSDHVDRINFEGILFAAKTAFELAFRMSNLASTHYALEGEVRPALVTEEQMIQSCGHHSENIYSQLMHVSNRPSKDTE